MAKGKRAKRNAVTPKPKPKKPKIPPQPVLADGAAAGRARIAAHGDYLALCVGPLLRLHTVDKPIRQIRPGAQIVAVAQSDRYAAALDRLGTLHLYDLKGEMFAAKPAGEFPRSLLWAGNFIALFEAGIAIFDQSGTRIGLVDFPRPLVAAADPDGTIVICGEDKRLAELSGTTLTDIPPSVEQIVAIAPLGKRRFICAGVKNMFLLDLAQRELEALYAPSESPYVAATESRVAWASKGMVSIGRIVNGKLERDQLVTYPGTYSQPANDVLSVQGLAWLDDDRLAIALDAGRGNIIIVNEQKALKLDEQAGDPQGRWVFIYDGKILVAG